MNKKKRMKPIFVPLILILAGALLVLASCGELQIFFTTGILLWILAVIILVVMGILFLKRIIGKKVNQRIEQLKKDQLLIRGKLYRLAGVFLLFFGTIFLLWGAVVSGNGDLGRKYPFVIMFLWWDIVIVASLLIGLGAYMKKRAADQPKPAVHTRVSAPRQPVPKTCKGCGKTIESGTLCEQCEYELLHTKCEECGSDFPKVDMHLVDGKFFCHDCFMKKFANFGGYGEAVEEDMAPCFPMIKALFSVHDATAPEEDVLKKLCGKPVYIIGTTVTNMPLCYMDRLCAYDSLEKANAAVEKYILNKKLKKELYIFELKPEILTSRLQRYSCAGFRAMVVNNEFLVNFSALPVYKEATWSDTFNPEACNYMMCYKERKFALVCDEKTTGEPSSSDELKKLEMLYDEAVKTLVRGSVFYPNGMYETVTDSKNKKWIAVFTDYFAAEDYNHELEERKLLKNTVMTLCDAVEKDPEIRGIIVNPGREAFTVIMD